MRCWAKLVFAGLQLASGVLRLADAAGVSVTRRCKSGDGPLGGEEGDELADGGLAGAGLGPCVPKASSMSSDQAIFVDQATGARLLLDAVLIKIDRFG
jgi:hypothetical protein